MNAPQRVILAAGLKPSTVGPLRSALQPWGRLEVSAQLRHTMDRARQLRPAMVILPADRGAGLAACDRLRTDDSLGEPVVWLLSEEGLTARVAAHWLRPTRAHLYGVLPLSPEFIEREVGPLLPEAADEPAPTPAPLDRLYGPPTVRHSTDDDPPEPDRPTIQASSTRLRERLEATRSELRAAERAQAASQAKLAEMREALATAHADLAKRHDDLRRVTESAQRDRHRVDELEDALDAATRTGEQAQAELSEKLERLQAAHEASQRDLHATRRDIETLQAHLQETVERHRSEATARTELERRVEALRQREGGLHQTLQVTRAAAEAEGRRRTEALERLEQALAEAEARLQTQETQHDQERSRLEEQLRTAQLAAAAHADHDRRHADSTTELQAELTDLRQQLDVTRQAHHADQQRWATERERLIETRDEAQARAEATAAGTSEERAKLLALTDSTDRLRRERDTLEETVAALHTRIAGFERTEARLTRELADLTRERDAFRADRDDLVGVRARLRSRLDVAEQEREAFRAELKEARDALAASGTSAGELRRERDALREERNRLAEQHLPVVEERNRLRAELGPLRTSRDQADQALHATRARLSQLRTELDAAQEKALELEIRAGRSATGEAPSTEAGGDRWQELAEETQASNVRLRSEVKDLARRVTGLTRELEQTRSEGRELSRRLAAAELEASEARSQQIQDLDWFMDTLRAIKGTPR